MTKLNSLMVISAWGCGLLIGWTILPQINQPKPLGNIQTVLQACNRAATCSAIVYLDRVSLFATTERSGELVGRAATIEEAAAEIAKKSAAMAKALTP